MSDIEEQGETEFGQFGALTAEQEAIVNAFAEMVRNGQIPVQTQVPRHNEGGTNNGEGGNGDPNQVEDTQERLGDEMETESLRINLQHITSVRNISTFGYISFEITYGEGRRYYFSYQRRNKWRTSLQNRYHGQRYDFVVTGWNLPCWKIHCE